MSLRIGITQRVEEIASHGERRDCLDQRWFILLEQLGLAPVPIPNRLANVAAWFDVMALGGFILSGGNDLMKVPNPSHPAPERDQTEEALLVYAADQELPVLGVCRGFQMMNVHLGGDLTPAEGHVASRHSVRAATDDLLFPPYIEVNSFHDWAIRESGLAGELQPCLSSPDGGIEAVKHTNRKWIGIMWHPERESPFAQLDTELITQLFRGSG